MSNIKISDLGQAGTLTGVELAPIVQDNETVRTTLNQIKAFASIAISNDIIGDAASTTLAPSVNAIKTYTDGLVVGLLNDRGNYTPDITSPGDYPSSGGSGVGGAIQKGDIWFINGNGFLGTTAVVIGASVRALVNNASPTTDSNWDILDAGLIQSNLQNVLTAGNTANLTLVLTNNPYTSTFASSYISFYNTSGANSVYNSAIFNIANSAGNYISGSVNNFKVYNAFSNNSTELYFNSVKYNNSGFVGSLETSTLTSSQTWTLPNATGTIALANNVWNATGNAGTVAGTNFIGTTDLIDFVAKTNNTERLRVLSTGQVKLSSLTGTGTRMVVANATGQLATQTITSPTLQTVTNAGNTTTNDIISSSISSSITAQSSYDSASATLNAIGGESGYLILTTSTGLTSTLSPMALTGSRTYFLPDNDGTIALLSDINTSNSWKTIGNAGTIPGTDFIGTTDNVDLVFKRNNIEQLRILSNRIDSSLGIFSKATYPYIVAMSSASADKYVALSYDAGLSLESGFLEFSRNGISARIFGNNIATSDKVLELPNASGTIALTSDITPPTLQTATSGTNKNLTNGINLQGTNAGGGNTGAYNINAFGTNAAQDNTGIHVNGLGLNGAAGNTGNYVNALGLNAGFGNTGYNVNAIGNGAGQGNVNSQVNAIGQQAAYQNNGLNVNAIGYQVAYQNYGQSVNAMGYAAAKSNLGSDTNAFGTNAALSNEGQYVNAIGNQAAGSNTGNHVNGIGQFAAYNSIGNYVNAIGYNTGNGNTGASVNAMGSNAANGNTGDYVNAIGSDASDGNSGSNVNAFGALAAFNNSGSSVNAFGLNAAKDNTISGATVFSNTSLPTYVNHAAAAVAITVLLGASVNCTYLYHNQATDSIGAVRL